MFNFQIFYDFYMSSYSDIPKDIKLKFANNLFCLTVVSYFNLFYFSSYLFFKFLTNFYSYFNIVNPYIGFFHEFSFWCFISNILIVFGMFIYTGVFISKSKPKTLITSSAISLFYHFNYLKNY